MLQQFANVCNDELHRSILSLNQRPVRAGLVPMGEDGSQLCSGSFLRFAAPGADRSIRKSSRRLLNGSFRELVALQQRFRCTSHECRSWADTCYSPSGISKSAFAA
jgi:hypothetical protein